MLMRLWREDEGVLTFEWIMLLTLLVIGVIGGVAGIRDAINQQCQNVVGAITSMDQSYIVAPPLVVSTDDISDAGTNCASSSSNGFGYIGGGNFGVGRGGTISTSNSANAPCLPVGLPGVPPGSF